MTSRKYNSIFNQNLVKGLLLTALLWIGNAQAHTQSIDTVLVNEAMLKADDPVFISSTSADVEVVTHAGNALKVEYHLKIEGRSEKEAREFLNAMKKAVDNQQLPTTSKTAIGSPLYKWKQVNGKTTITLKNDSKKYQIKKWDIKIRVEMPENAQTHIAMNFGDLSITRLKNSADISISSGNVSIGSAGDLKLKANFAKKIEIGTVSSANMVLNSSKMTISEVGSDLKLKGSFSTVDAGTIGKKAKLSLNSSSFSVQSVDTIQAHGNFVRSFKVEKLNMGRLSLNSSNFAVEQAGRLEISGANFSKFEIENCPKIRVGGTSSSKFHIENVDRMHVSGSRFSSFKIEKLSKEFSVNASSGDMTIEHVKKGFERIRIKGQFFDTKIHLDEGADCEIQGNFQFPDYDFKGFKTTKQVTTNGVEKITATRGNEPTSKISLNCQSCDIVVD